MPPTELLQSNKVNIFQILFSFQTRTSSASLYFAEQKNNFTELLQLIIKVIYMKITF